MSEFLKSWRCQNLKVSEYLKSWKCQNFWNPEGVRIWKYQNLKVSESERVRIFWNPESIRIFKILKVSESESVRIFKILKASESESVRILKILGVSELPEAGWCKKAAIIYWNWIVKKRKILTGAVSRILLIEAWSLPVYLPMKQSVEYYFTLRHLILKSY